VSAARLDTWASPVCLLLDGNNLGGEDVASPTRFWTRRPRQRPPTRLTARARTGRATPPSPPPSPSRFNNDMTPPAVTLTAPAAGAKPVGAATVRPTPAQTRVFGVQFLLDWRAPRRRGRGGAFPVSWDTATAPTGAHVLKPAPAMPPATSRPPSAFPSPYQRGRHAPERHVDRPANGATVSGTVAVSANAGDNIGVGGVQFLLDDVPWAEKTLPRLSRFPGTPRPRTGGSHVLKAVARDTAGNLTTSVPVHRLRRDRHRPSHGCHDGRPQMVRACSGTVTVSANASDRRRRVGVQFLLNGAALRGEDTAAPYSITGIPRRWPTARTLSRGPATPQATPPPPRQLR